MKTLQFIATFLLMLSGAGPIVKAQVKGHPWAIKRYIKYLPLGTVPKASKAPRVMSLSTISTNNAVYPSSNPQTEVSGAIYSGNPQDIMLGANTVLTGTGQGWYATTDGGLDWIGSDYYPNGSQNLGDPVIVSDYSGHFFDFAIGFAGQYDSYGNALTDGIIVAKTTNDGQTWEPTVTSVDPTYGLDDDKPMAVSDDNLFCFSWKRSFLELN